MRKAWYGQKRNFCSGLAGPSVVRLHLYADLELLLHVHELVVVHGVPELTVVAHARVS